MTLDHRRPLVAYLLCAVLCGVVIVSSMVRGGPPVPQVRAADFLDGLATPGEWLSTLVPPTTLSATPDAKSDALAPSVALIQQAAGEPTLGEPAQPTEAAPAILPGPTVGSTTVGPASSDAGDGHAPADTPQQGHHTQADPPQGDPSQSPGTGSGQDPVGSGDTHSSPPAGPGTHASPGKGHGHAFGHDRATTHRAAGDHTGVKRHGHAKRHVGHHGKAKGHAKHHGKTKHHGKAKGHRR